METAIGQVTPEIKWVSRVTKATLLHTDATQSEIKIITPIYSQWGEAQEKANHYLCEYINELTRRWISIVGYQIHMGSVDNNGNEDYPISYEPFQIPLDKIYFDGEWRTPEEIKNN